jgi:hypothetical protein
VVRFPFTVELTAVLPWNVLVAKPDERRRRPADHSNPRMRELSEWAIQDSNLGPLPYQRSALTD